MQLGKDEKKKKGSKMNPNKQKGGMKRKGENQFGPQESARKGTRKDLKKYRNPEARPSNNHILVTDRDLPLSGDRMEHIGHKQN